MQKWRHSCYTAFFVGCATKKSHALCVFDSSSYIQDKKDEKKPTKPFVLFQNQYKFVFETLLEYTRGIDSRFPVSELANKIKERGVKDKKTKKNVYQMEYEVRILPKTRCGRIPCRIKNKNKVLKSLIKLTTPFSQIFSSAINCFEKKDFLA